MAKIYIYIYATENNPDTLNIVDGQGHCSNTKEMDIEFCTNLRTGDFVNWVVLDFEGNAISAVDDIKMAHGDNECFKIPPAPNPDDENVWSAEVGHVSGDVTLEYTIYYTVGEKQYSQDPKLRFRPRIRS